MGRYWDSEGPNQETHDRLVGKLVPLCGNAGTLEGEFLRAADKLTYEFYNNGGGNNVSGALRFLRDRYPDFDFAWWDALAPYVTGRGGVAPQKVYDACEAMLDSVVLHVAAKKGRYVPSEEDMHGYTVEETGYEPEERDEDDDDDFYVDDDVDEEPVTAP